jgi:hypothetical protein
MNTSAHVFKYAYKHTSHNKKLHPNKGLFLNQRNVGPARAMFRIDVMLSNFQYAHI